jgi:dynactin 6
MTSIAAGEEVPDMTIIHSNGSRRKDRRRDAAEIRQKFQSRQIGVLRQLIPSNPAKFQ